MKNSAHPGSIMVVDDEIFFRTMLREMLAEYGYEVIAEAEDGNEAVAKYSAYRPEIVVIDIYMPGKNGLETAGDIFAIDNDAKILMCSGSAFGDDIDAALNLGVSGVVQKPFIPEELIGTIKKIMGDE